jgi:hypothetical protein
VELPSVGTVRISKLVKSSFRTVFVGSGTNGSKGFFAVPKSLEAVIFIALDEVDKKLNCK